MKNHTTHLRSVIVPNVRAFACHIACDKKSKSEIVVPVRDKQGAVAAVFNVDSRTLNSFDKEDQNGLEMIADLIYKQDLHC